MASIGFDSNIDEVIDSVDDVADDLYHEMKKRLEPVIMMLKAKAVQYVMEDSNTTGALARSLHTESGATDSGLQFVVASDASIAPYAAIVEFGSGDNTNRPSKISAKHGLQPDTGSAVPRDFPYEAPDIDFNKMNKYDTESYEDFQEFIGQIMDWMEKKPVTPATGDIYLSAVAIAAEIIEKGNLAHPFMRPAWFDRENSIRRAARNALTNATR